MNISRFQNDYVFLHTMFSDFLTAGFVGLSNAVTQGKPTCGAFSSSITQIRE